MAVTETLELEEGLRRELDRDLDAVIVNGTMPRRFTREELGANRAGHGDGGNGADANVASNAVRMARTVERSCPRPAGADSPPAPSAVCRGSPPAVLTVPFAFVPVFDLDAVAERSR